MGTATCISSSLHVDAAVVAVPRRIVLCVPGQVSLLWARRADCKGCYSFLWRRKSVRAAAPFTSSAAQRFLWAPDVYSTANAFCKCNWQPHQHHQQQQQQRCSISWGSTINCSTVTTKTCWLSFRWDSFPQTKRKYVKCKCISVGSVSCFKATITRNRAARQMRRQLHEGPPGTTFMPDNVEIRCEFSLHICLSLSLGVCVWSGQVLNSRIAYDNRILLVSRAVRRLHNCRLASVTSAILTVWGKLSGSSVITANVVIIYLTGLPTYFEISLCTCPCLCHI